MNASTRSLAVTFVLATPLLAEPHLEIFKRDEGVPGLEARDSGNGAWTLEVSSDLIHWQPMGQVVVRNTVLPLEIQEPFATGRYFRLRQDTAAPPRTVEAMLDDAIHTRTDFNRQMRGTRVIESHAALGRVLFHDRRLSRNNSVSCASCHLQEHAFADNVPLSRGHSGRLTTRNSISLTHASTYGRRPLFFWDGRASRLDQAVLDPITHADEMGLTLEEMVGKLSAEPYYLDLFLSHLGSPEITSGQVGLALAAFTAALDTKNSRYDQEREREFQGFTPAEKRGLELFRTNCRICHAEPDFVSGGFSNNGLETKYADPGLGGGRFRRPSLRQVALTAPYMHDGRFATLRDVLDFYSEGIAPHRELHSSLPVGGFGFTEQEKDDLEAFLNTLTDRTVVDSPLYSDPFRKD